MARRVRVATVVTVALVAGMLAPGSVGAATVSSRPFVQVTPVFSPDHQDVPQADAEFNLDAVRANDVSNVEASLDVWIDRRLLQGWEDYSTLPVHPGQQLELELHLAVASTVDPENRLRFSNLLPQGSNLLAMSVQVETPIVAADGRTDWVPQPTLQEADDSVVVGPGDRLTVTYSGALPVNPRAFGSPLVQLNPQVAPEFQAGTGPAKLFYYPLQFNRVPVWVNLWQDKPLPADSFVELIPLDTAAGAYVVSGADNNLGGGVAVTPGTYFARAVSSTGALLQPSQLVLVEQSGQVTPLAQPDVEAVAAEQDVWCSVLQLVPWQPSFGTQADFAAQIKQTCQQIQAAGTPAAAQQLADTQVAKLLEQLLTAGIDLPQLEGPMVRYSKDALRENYLDRLRNARWLIDLVQHPDQHPGTVGLLPGVLPAALLTLLQAKNALDGLGNLTWVNRVLASQEFALSKEQYQAAAQAVADAEFYGDLVKVVGDATALARARTALGQVPDVGGLNDVPQSARYQYASAPAQKMWDDLALPDFFAQRFGAADATAAEIYSKFYDTKVAYRALSGDSWVNKTGILSHLPLLTDRQQELARQQLLQVDASKKLVVGKAGFADFTTKLQLFAAKQWVIQQLAEALGQKQVEFSGPVNSDLEPVLQGVLSTTQQQWLAVASLGELLTQLKGQVQGEEAGPVATETLAALAAVGNGKDLRADPTEDDVAELLEVMVRDFYEHILFEDTDAVAWDGAKDARRVRLLQTDWTTGEDVLPENAVADVAVLLSTQQVRKQYSQDLAKALELVPAAGEQQLAAAERYVEQLAQVVAASSALDGRDFEQFSQQVIFDLPGISNEQRMNAWLRVLEPNQQSEPAESALAESETQQVQPDERQLAEQQLAAVAAASRAQTTRQLWAAAVKPLVAGTTAFRNNLEQAMNVQTDVDNVRYTEYTDGDFATSDSETRKLQQLQQGLADLFAADERGEKFTSWQQLTSLQSLSVASLQAWQGLLPGEVSTSQALRAAVKQGRLELVDKPHFYLADPIARADYLRMLNLQPWNDSEVDRALAALNGVQLLVDFAAAFASEPVFSPAQQQQFQPEEGELLAPFFAGDWVTSFVAVSEKRVLLTELVSLQQRVQEVAQQFTANPTAGTPAQRAEFLAQLAAFTTLKEAGELGPEVLAAAGQVLQAYRAVTGPLAQQIELAQQQIAKQTADYQPAEVTQLQAQLGAATSTDQVDQLLDEFASKLEADKLAARSRLQELLTQVAAMQVAEADRSRVLQLVTRAQVAYDNPSAGLVSLRDLGDQLAAVSAVAATTQPETPAATGQEQTEAPEKQGSAAGSKWWLVALAVLLGVLGVGVGWALAQQQPR